MKKNILQIIIIVLVILNVILLWQNQALKSTVVSKSPKELPADSSYLVEVDGRKMDLRGLYTYPGIGKYFIPSDNEMSQSSSLMLTIFLLQETVAKGTSCPLNLSEVKVYKRLNEIFQARNQLVVVVTERPDSVAVVEFLKTEHLDDIPMMVLAPDSGYTLTQIGISPRFMPFKILYDSTLTPIYMRGADNTPKSQADFEKAVLLFSDLANDGYKSKR